MCVAGTTGEIDVRLAPIDHDLGGPDIGQPILVRPYILILRSITTQVSYSGSLPDANAGAAAGSGGVVVTIILHNGGVGAALDFRGGLNLA